MGLLETRVPPPVVTLVFGGLLWVAARLLPALTVGSSGRDAVAILLALLGILVELVGGITLVKSCTTVNPLQPATASSVVTTGIYRYSRNPIYLGDLLLLIGWAVYLGNVLALALVPLFVAYINRFQIGPEERILADKFGESYDVYRSRVRRWV